MRLIVLSILFLFTQVEGFSQSGFSLFLIGDAGQASVSTELYKRLLQEQIQNANSAQAIIFLGDNIYPKGMPGINSPERKESERILTNQIALVREVKGQIYFIPGNHDWKQGRKEGWGYIQQQQQWIDSLKNPQISFQPRGGCPGPVEILLSDQLTLVILDTQWILHPFDKPEGEDSECEAKTSGDIITQLEDILKRNRHRRVVITGHHPAYTYGEHGGIFAIKDHLFPLTAINKNLYVPLPGIGSVYPLYRKFFGNIQDISHPVYKQFRLSLTSLLKEYPGTVYASGHEHTLQYIEKDSVHYIVSGSGVKSTAVKKKGYAQFVSSDNGFVKLSVNENGSGRLDYFNGDGIVFSRELLPIPQMPESSGNAGEEIGARSVTVKASSRYEATKKHELWLGENYRKEWGQPIQVPVFNLAKEKGGLKIIQRGGGMQTLSLRLEDSLGREFTLRSIEKFPEKAVPEAFRKTFAQDLVQDQISAAHPYGALVVPFLAEAAGIYHTNPKVVYIPDDPNLGMYQKDFAHQLMLFEERPSGSGKGMDFFGNAEKIISTDKLLEKLASDNENRVDQKFVLRSRLFDLWIGDWDRHDDQWRWGEWDDKKGNSYRPIPRDRDQAFFVNEGRIPKYWSKPWLLPKFEGFKEKVSWPSGLMFNGRYFDRSFLTELTKDEWIKMAEDLAASMTDDVIESAIKKWPPEIYNLHGKEIIQKLKARRSLLPNYAEDHYLFLTRAVDVVGSNKKELFEIEHQLDGSVKIQMFKSSKEKEKGRKLYDRTFFEGETREVRLYGLGGDDQFETKGGGSKIKVRIIGGEGLDQLEIKGEGKPLLYDTKDGVKVNGKDYKNFTSMNPKVNEYNRRSFIYNRYAPLVYGNYNIDDGVFVGGGFLINTHGFRKDPYKARHLFLGSVALNTASFNFKYDGRFSKVIGQWNFEIDADIKSPNFVNNFFGWGNESIFDKRIDDQPGINVEHPIDYYRVRFREYAIELKVSRSIGQAGFFKIGPAFQHIGLEDTDKDRYIKTYAASRNEPLLDVGRNFTGITYSWGFDKRNHKTVTTRGIYFQQTSRWMEGLREYADEFASHSASLSFYQTFRFPARVTFAFRAGGGLNNGSYEFYQAQILDGKTDVRGFRKTRFYGNSKLYFNNEVRIKLMSFRSYLFPASLGITGFYDVGRVWYKDSAGFDSSSITGNSSRWHKGYGGGVWFTPYNLTVLSTEVGHSVEGTLFYIRLGFLF